MLSNFCAGAVESGLRAKNALVAMLDGANNIGGNTNVQDVVGKLETGTVDSSFSKVGTFVDNMGQTGFTLGQKIGVYVVAIVIVVTGIMFLIHGGNANKTAEVKTSIVPKIIGACLIFGVMGIIGLLQSMGANLF